MKNFYIKYEHNHTESINNNNISLYKIKNFKNKYSKRMLSLNNSKEKPKLQLTIKNMTPNYLKTPILSTKERHMKMFFNHISLLKSIPNTLIKDINDMINSTESEDYEDKDKDINFSIKNKKKSSIDLSLKNENNKNFYIKKINIHNKLNNERTKTKTYSNFNYTPTIYKKMKNYIPHYYPIQQLKIKNNRYEKTHNEAFEDFQSKININENYKKMLNNENNQELYRPLALGIVEPSKHLFKTKKMNHKLIYLHESRMRDLTIAKLLRNEYNSNDIKRILNGKKPLKYHKTNKIKKKENSHLSEINKKENE